MNVDVYTPGPALRLPTFEIAGDVRERLRAR
jgi:hypothetical protein